MEKDYLYEVLASTYSLVKDGKEIRPNTSCMGIRLEDNNLIKVGPYQTTNTYKNLRENNIITINFVDNVYLYALAALKEPESSISLTEFPPQYYEFMELASRAVSIPYIKDAWGILICEVEKEFEETRINGIGETIIPVFKLKVIYSEKFRDSFKLWNRAENIILEIIILATRLKIAKENNNRQLYNEVYGKIVDHINNIKRFGKNRDALNALDLINRYIRISLHN